MVCEFCGREIETRRVPYLPFDIPVPCECEGARARREEEDRQERRDEFDMCLRKAVATAGIPPKFRLYPEYGDGESGVYMYGEQGRGKTEMACGMLRKFLSDGIVEVGHNRFISTRSARFVTAPELMMRLKKTYDMRGVSEEDVLGAYAGVGMLCLDDLGKGPMTDWAIGHVYTLLDIRSKYERPTIITSQYDGAALIERLASRGDRETALAIWSRIEGMCKVGHVKGRDWRRQR